MNDKTNGTKSPRMEERLYQNRYQVDEGRPHVKINHQPGGDSEELKALTRICPAGCYSINEEGQVEVAADGCMECGTCRIVCQATGELEWSYPRGGYGVLFKFG
ncbi:ferredoxin family protein [Rhodovulum sulfidophilum]|uniref:ferredoxin family protein n=1 Tax=Rhodovulum sulfidophilum TaxID=35806 RepID=UPI000950EAC5|nr:ferredoxin family protein [Rhodovulum sulfidophilum]MBL3575196.1 ferredoxin family protein [Rhodovulum sulfidophilum]MCE8432448.1 ferredoxin family protein [Rhodovulum sulfidophilum]MCF4116286.1 ferredoxin family protein [Rhodovulum sulfidophilum]OLS51229.1 ferredoxin family protein [Rhodovulum sulfidophilum]